MVAPLAAVSLAVDVASSITSALSPQKPATGSNAKMRATAEDFETVYLNSMFQQMFAGVDGEGPFGGTTGTGPWRSMLTDEFAKSFVKKGGIGIADHVYASLLAKQEAANPTVKP